MMYVVKDPPTPPTLGLYLEVCVRIYIAAGSSERERERRKNEYDYDQNREYLIRN